MAGQLFLLLLFLWFLWKLSDLLKIIPQYKDEHKIKFIIVKDELRNVIAQIF